MPRQATDFSPEAVARRAQQAAHRAALKNGTATRRVIFAEMTPQEVKEYKREGERRRRATRLGKTVEQLRPVANRDQMAARLKKLTEIAEEVKPATVRQIYYRAVVANLVTKDDSGYQKVAKALTRLRLRGGIPWEWIRDPGRFVDVPNAWDNIPEFLRSVKQSFRLNFWKHKDSRVMIFMEKDALAGAIAPVTNHYRVPTVLVRGTSSWSLLKEAADHVNAFAGPTYIYYFCDFDPKGLEACNMVRETMANKWVSNQNKTETTDLIADVDDVHFKIVGLHSRKQVADMGLPTRKNTTKRGVGKKWIELVGPQSCELDAIEPHELRRMVEASINNHMTRAEADKLHEREAKLTKSMSRQISRKRKKTLRRKSTAK